jgi:hypothetical protein
MPPNAKAENPAKEALDSDVVERICKVFLIMSSLNDGDKLAAMHALDHALKANGVDYHVLVARMRKPWLSDSDSKLFRAKLAEAKEAGKREALLLNSPRRLDEFQRTDGRADWREIARYVDQERHRLTGRYVDDWWNEFITNIATLAMSSYPITLSEKRERKLLEVFAKLGGKIT